MAERHWVGGTGNWNGTAASKWSLTEGGAGGEAEPTSADDVYLDAGSGTVTVTTSASTRPCRNLICTGFTGTLAGGQVIQIHGNLLLVAGMGYTATSQLQFLATDAGHTITTAGKSVGAVVLNGVSGAWALTDALNCGANSITLTNGTFNTGGFAVSCSAISSNNSNTRVLTIDNSTVTLDGSSATPWTFGNTTGTASSLTFSATGSTVVLNTTSTTNYTCNFNTKTFNIITIAGSGTGTVSLLANTDAMIIGTLNYTGGSARTLIFSSTRNHTITNWNVNGAPGYLVTIQASAAGSAFTLTKTGGGVVAATYLAVKDCTGSPADTWSTAGGPLASINLGGNSGWLFLLPQASTRTGAAARTLATARSAATTRTAV